MAKHPKLAVAKAVKRASNTRAVGAVANNCLMTMLLAPMWIVLGVLLAPYTLFKRSRKRELQADYYDSNSADEDCGPGCICDPVMVFAAHGETEYAKELLKDL